MDDSLALRLKEVRASYDETVAELSLPDIVADQARYTAVARRHAELRPVVEAFDRYQEADTERAEARELARAEDDPDMVAYLEGVAAEKQSEMDRLEAELRRLLVPRDPNDSKDVIMEIRSAAGGDEAALWAADLYRMYQRHAERHGWAIEPIATSYVDGGGLKEATFAVKGRGAYSRLKFEAGPHRVQRVPVTESSGRVHTSIATVAVLPEADDIELDIKEADVKTEVFRSQGPGGQSVNTTDSAVRLTHLPSGLVVICQDEKSQLQNRLKAMRVLRARLYQQLHDEQLSEISGSRREQVGTGERAEKIRTYNFRENRVTDHRVGLTIKRLPTILDGDLDEFTEALMADDEARRLAEGDG